MLDLMILALAVAGTDAQPFEAVFLAREETYVVLRRPVTPAQAALLQRRGLAEAAGPSRAGEPGVIADGCHTMRLPMATELRDTFRGPDRSEYGVRVHLSWDVSEGYVVTRMDPVGSASGVLRCRL